jgi:hypothetical protein
LGHFIFRSLFPVPKIITDETNRTSNRKNRKTDIPDKLQAMPDNVFKRLFHSGLPMRLRYSAHSFGFTQEQCLVCSLPYLSLPYPAQCEGCLHFNVPEGVAHKAHHHSKVGQKPLVLLGLNVPGQHESIAPVIPAELQPFYIIVKIEIVKGQVFLKLVFVDSIVRAHLGNTALAVVYTALSGYYY